MLLSLIWLGGGVLPKIWVMRTVKSQFEAVSIKQSTIALF